MLFGAIDGEATDGPRLHCTGFRVLGFKVWVQALNKCAEYCLMVLMCVFIGNFISCFTMLAKPPLVTRALYTCMYVFARLIYNPCLYTDGVL